MGYIAPTLSADWGIKKQDLGPVLSAALLGLSFGALLAGPISDRMGRKRVLVFSCLFWPRQSGNCLCPDAEYAHILALSHRAGSGAAMPNAITPGVRICTKTLSFNGD